MTIRVLIADDHPLYRAGLRLLLDQPDTLVVAEASTGEDAVRLALELLPDVVVMDIAMPILDGIEATRLILESAPDVAVLLLTMMDDSVSVDSAMRAGARGYLVKGAGGDDVLRSVQAVAAGQLVLDSAVAKRASPWVPADAARTAFDSLTVREREITKLMAAGFTNSAIAERLYLREKSVRNYVSAIFRKLGAANRVEAVLAIRAANPSP